MDTSPSQPVCIPILLSVNHDNGQRRYGPPLDWNSAPPPRGTEVFVGKLPRSMSDMRLIQALSSVGPLYEVRQMLELSGDNRGYCFAVYQTLDGAKRACSELNNVEIEPGRRIGVVRSVDNRRLFVGGIPREICADDIMVEIKKLSEGCEEVVVYPSVTDKSKNRGFAFVEYRDHKTAAHARKQFIREPLLLWGKSACVDWAEPEQQVDNDIMDNVKILYVRNLMLSTDEMTLLKYFEMSDTHCIERVKKIRDFAFIHFTSRDKALHALNKLNRTKLDGSTIEVCLAKPPERGGQRTSRTVSQNDSGVGSLTSSRSPSVNTKPELPLLPPAFPLQCAGFGYNPAMLNPAASMLTCASPYLMSQLLPYAPLIQQIQNICVPGVQTPSKPATSPLTVPLSLISPSASATLSQLSAAAFANINCIAPPQNSFSDMCNNLKRVRDRRGSAGLRSAGVQARTRLLMKRPPEATDCVNGVASMSNLAVNMAPPPYSKVPAFLDGAVQYPWNLLNSNLLNSKVYRMAQQAAMVTEGQSSQFEGYSNA